MPEKDNTPMDTVRIDHSSRVATIAPTGRLDLETSPRLRRTFVRLLKGSVNCAIVDLRSVDRIDTSGIATLVELALILRERGGRVVACALTPDKTDSLSLAQAGDVLTICESPDEAMALLEPGANDETQ